MSDNETQPHGQPPSSAGPAVASSPQTVRQVSGQHSKPGHPSTPSRSVGGLHRTGSNQVRAPATNVMLAREQLANQSLIIPLSSQSPQRPQPEWLKQVLTHLKQTRPDDRFEAVYRPNASGDERTHWKMKCVDW